MPLLWLFLAVSVDMVEGLFHCCFLQVYLVVMEISMKSSLFPGGEGVYKEWNYFRGRTQRGGGSRGSSPCQKPCPPLSPSKWNYTLYRGLWRAAFLSPCHSIPLRPSCCPLILKSLAEPQLLKGKTGAFWE